MIVAAPRIALVILRLVWKPLVLGAAALAIYAWVHHSIVSAERTRVEAERLRVVVAEKERQARATAEVLEAARDEGLKHQAEIAAMKELVDGLRKRAGGGCRLDPDLRRRLLDIR
jgi:hypothetical protein